VRLQFAFRCFVQFTASTPSHSAESWQLSSSSSRYPYTLGARPRRLVVGCSHPIITHSGEARCRVSRICGRSSQAEGYTSLCHIISRFKVPRAVLSELVISATATASLSRMDHVRTLGGVFQTSIHECLCQWFTASVHTSVRVQH
jgi:hypothetical protein